MALDWFLPILGKTRLDFAMDQKGIMASPEDREDIIAKAVEKLAGGDGILLELREDDWLVIIFRGA